MYPLNDLTMYRFENIFFVILLFAVTPAFTQVRDDEKAQEYLNQQEQFKKSQLLREYDSALFLMDDEQYARADQKFRYVLANIKSVPSDLTYHFGKNSFYLGNFKQSIDWLNKYIQLKGTNGQFYTQAVEWKKKAEEQFNKEKTQDAQKV